MLTKPENSSSNFSQKFKINVMLVGAGRTGSMLLKLLLNDPYIQVAGVIDLRHNAPGIIMAEKLSILTARNYEEVVLDDNIDMIINVTGDDLLQQKLSREKGGQTILIGKSSAMLIWTMLDDAKKKKILKDCFRKSSTDADGKLTGNYWLGNSDKMQEVERLVSQVAPTQTTVLIRGESGTGKEILARMIHSKSLYADKPFVTVNCTALSPTLIESELFGYKKGAFTGATKDHRGLFEYAHDGTLFLDEIGDMPISMQAKLLRFLQSGEFRSVGDFNIKKVNVRIIAATNRNLETAIEKNDFRTDLFYRLEAFNIHLPLLCERKEDIPHFAYLFLDAASIKLKKNIKRMTPEALARLNEYHWPGNVRELKNAIHRAAVLTTSDEITPKHLPAKLQKPEKKTIRTDDKNLNEGLLALKAKVVNEFEYEALCQYLEKCHGNVSKAAEAAKVPRRTFQRLMAKHNICSDVFKNQALFAANSSIADLSRVLPVNTI